MLNEISEEESWKIKKEERSKNARKNKQDDIRMEADIKKKKKMKERRKKVK